MITFTVSEEFECLNENFLLIKIRSMQEPYPLKQVFPLIKFIKPLTLIKPYMALSRGWAWKSPIIIKLSYALEKKSIIPVKDTRNRKSQSKGCIYVDITKHFSFLRVNSKGKACILNWNFGKEGWRDSVVTLTYTNKPPLLREMSSL